MNLYDFDPDKVCLLDGYYLVRKAFPKINLHDFEACERALALILSEVTLNAWGNVGSSIAQFWLKISFNKKIKGSHPFSNIESNYGLGILTPDGKVFDSVMNNNIVGTFVFEDEKYAEFANGLIVSLRPSLDRRFLKLYSEKTRVDGLDYFDTLDVVV